MSVASCVLQIVGPFIFVGALTSGVLVDAPTQVRTVVIPPTQVAEMQAPAATSVHERIDSSGVRHSVI